MSRLGFCYRLNYEGSPSKWVFVYDTLVIVLSRSLCSFYDRNYFNDSFAFTPKCVCHQYVAQFSRIDSAWYWGVAVIQRLSVRIRGNESS